MGAVFAAMCSYIEIQYQGVRLRQALFFCYLEQSLGNISFTDRDELVEHFELHRGVVLTD